MIKAIFKSPIPTSWKKQTVFNEKMLGYYVSKIINLLWKSSKTHTPYGQNAKVKNVQSRDNMDDHSGLRDWGLYITS
jgi:hypothetical protein